MALEKTYTRNEAIKWPYPNYWDLLALCLILGLIILFGWGAKQMTASYQVGQAIHISLSPSQLPYYALRTVLRLFIALFFSLLFTFTFATWAAKSKYAERLIIPMIDVFQSVPVFGFLAIISSTLVAIFHGSMLGPEIACIFAIFTAQVWNIALSFYQSLRTVPLELREAAKVLQLSPWQTFWRIDVPFATPSLLWNMMLSMSASWFVEVASEAITVANNNIMLPGIGSYIAVAIQQADKWAVFYVILTMLIVIFLYDQLLFRPLINWAEKFKFEQMGEEKPPRSWVIQLFQRTKLLPYFSIFLGRFWRGFVNFPLFNIKSKMVYTEKKIDRRFFWVVISYAVFFILLMAAIWSIVVSIMLNISWHEILHVFGLGLITGFKVMLLIFLCSLIWIPIGVWIGLRDDVSEIVQPIVQFLAAFPAYLLFPIVVMAIVRFNLNVDIWTAPLMILGTQWYILFNVVAGASALPKDLRQAAENFHVRGWLWWKRFILPGIFPYYVTGAITAAGGAWNVSILAEVVSWGNKTLVAHGLGAYITQNYNAHDFTRLTLGICVMTIFVLLINRFVWRPIYNLARERYEIA